MEEDHRTRRNVLDDTNIGDKYELVDQGVARSLIIHDAQQEDIAYYSCGGAGGQVKPIIWWITPVQS